MHDPDAPLIVQGDRSVLLDVHTPQWEAARDALARFAELEKSPEHVHTYRLTPLSLWNAASAGASVAEVLDALRTHARYGVPDHVATDIADTMGRYGRLRLLPAAAAGTLRLEVDDDAVAEEIARNPSTGPLVRRAAAAAAATSAGEASFEVDLVGRGTLKQKLARLGWPVEDRVGFVDGEPLDFALRDPTTAGGRPFAVRPYQRAAVDAFLRAGAGHGVVVLPCGAGKTVVGMAAAAALRAETLILCTNVVAARQWMAELLDKTTLRPDQVGEYDGRAKEVRPVTCATYQILSRRRGDAYPHFALFTSRPWGLIIYDEVHLLPAPVFRITAEIQARRRLGLTATLVREDGLQTDVFSLIGPKRHDVPWKEMERDGFIATAACQEVRVDVTSALRAEYAAKADDPHAQYRVAACNALKDEVVVELLARHAGEHVLVIGQYIAQLERLARRLGAPLITGETPTAVRERLYADFRAGRERLLVVSKVANFSIDLPEASVLVQVSGTFGSRQEEAQRLGRVLRPKARGAFFYSLVSRDTSEQRFGLNRQLFLTEQGYRYAVEDWRLQAGPGGATGDGAPQNVTVDAAETTPVAAPALNLAAAPNARS
ncbi:MAG TPA: DNA repair helicase XPB [Myxococcota bacterium]|jgi:DNA excision repair protein ERCC-3|nr:DNA repair helicase XPB [Myxococcota bacterium]